VNKFLAECGVRVEKHQKILLGALPCGIRTPKAVCNDSTLVDVNAPRALLVCHWKGMLAAFRYLEMQD